MKTTKAKTAFPASLLCDFYKVSHKNLYPTGTEVIYSTFTPRSSKHGNNVDSVVFFGLQGFIKKYLVNYFEENFFSRDVEDVVAEYERVIKFTLGDENPDATHLRELHQLGYLPIEVKAIKEGTQVPIKVPVLTIENTHPKFFWLTNYLETLISTELWQATTSATKARDFRKLLDEYAMKTVGNTNFVGFNGHDFSMRGMSSLESAQLSGAGHLLSFVGTDTIPAILYLEEYYKADIEKEMVGVSVKATEHSIQCAYGRDELEAFTQIIDKTPSGILSIVSDTYDLFDVIENILPQLKEKIMSRDGKIVIRPDSGLPEDILCGNPNGETEAERKGVIESLHGIFGGTVNSKGYIELDEHIGAIYGDSIDYKRAETILKRLERKGFASSNVVLGLGSYFYQMNTRDTFGFAMKATYAEINGEPKMLFKDPKTDDGTKKSQKGRVTVYENIEGGLVALDGLTKETYENSNYEKVDLLETVFLNGELLREQSLAEIRSILNKK